MFSGIHPTVAMEISSGKTWARSNRGWHVVRCALAVLLLTSSALKCWQLATEPVIGTSLLDSRWLLMATVEFELFFGIWLLSGNLPKLTWAAAVTCFGLFTCVSLYKALSGYASCGCFGSVQVNPWYTTTLDLAIVLSLLYWRPHLLPSLSGRGAGGEGADWRLRTLATSPGEGKGEGMILLSPFGRAGGGEGEDRFPAFLTPHSSFIIPVALWLLLSLPAAYAMGSYTDTTLSDAGEIVGDGKTVVLEPEKWVGKRFPLLDYIDIGNKLSEGSWIVVLHRQGCPRCRELLDYFQQNRKQFGIGQGISMAIVEMSTSSQTPSSDWHEVGAIRGDYLWFLANPIALHLRDGVVEPHCFHTQDAQAHSLLDGIGG